MFNFTEEVKKWKELSLKKKTAKRGFVPVESVHPQVKNKNRWMYDKEPLQSSTIFYS